MNRENDAREIVLEALAAISGQLAPGWRIGNDPDAPLFPDLLDSMGVITLTLEIESACERRFGSSPSFFVEAQRLNDGFRTVGTLIGFVAWRLGVEA